MADSPQILTAVPAAKTWIPSVGQAVGLPHRNLPSRLSLLAAEPLQVLAQLGLEAIDLALAAADLRRDGRDRLSLKGEADDLLLGPRQAGQQVLDQLGQHGGLLGRGLRGRG